MNKGQLQGTLNVKGIIEIVPFVELFPPFTTVVKIASDPLQSPDTQWIPV